MFHGTLEFRAGGDTAGEDPLSSDTLGTYALEEKKPCAPRGQRRSETGLCPGKELDHLLSEATLEGGGVWRERLCLRLESEPQAVVIGLQR